VKKDPIPSDPRYLPLKTLITEQWLEHRGYSISACGKSCWIQLAAMLRRSNGHWTYETLAQSYQRFVTSKDPWDMKQTPAYWCSHPERYMLSNGNGSNGIGQDAMASNAQREQLEGLRRALDAQEWGEL
jgi:hypothetical protein